MLNRGKTPKKAMLVALGVALAAAGQARTEDAAQKIANRSLEQLHKAAEAGKRNDCKTVEKLARPLAQGGDETGLNLRGRAYASDLIASCLAATGKLDAAEAEMRRATADPLADDYAWEARLRIELVADLTEPAVETIEAMVDGRVGTLNGITLQWMWQLLSRIETAKADDLRARLLKVLAMPAYSPTEPLAQTDGFRARYAALLVERGDEAGARELIRELKRPQAIARASLDLRLRNLFSAPPDIRAAAEAALIEDRHALLEYPDILNPIISVAADLRLLGRPAEALAVLEAAEPRLSGADAYEDVTDRLPWWWDGLSTTYLSLGRIDDAVAALRSGAKLNEYGGLNVSQTINLASLQNDVGRGADALATLATFDKNSASISPFGEMQLRQERVCALALSDRASEAAADIAYVRAHEHDAPAAVVSMFACLGDEDNAAAATIRRLTDPEQRMAALLQLSEFDEPPVKLPESAADQLKKRLKSRADVRAAAAKAGGTRRFNIQNGQL